MTNNTTGDKSSGSTSGDVTQDAPFPKPRPMDFAAPVVIFVFAAVVAYLTTTFEDASPLIVGHAMQPRNFPLFLMAVICVLNVVLIIQTVLRPPSRRDLEPWQTWLSMVVLGLFFILAAYADLFLGIIVSMFVLSILWGERRLWVSTLVSVATPAIIFFVFDQVLKVRFPRGILTNLWYGA
ncbi:MAG: tripartite tricarboxylate transporter TctB family protein [Pseudomonadota bacterium]